MTYQLFLPSPILPNFRAPLFLLPPFLPLFFLFLSSLSSLSLSFSTSSFLSPFPLLVLENKQRADPHTLERARRTSILYTLGRQPSKLNGTVAKLLNANSESWTLHLSMAHNATTPGGWNGWRRIDVRPFENIPGGGMIKFRLSYICR